MTDPRRRKDVQGWRRVATTPGAAEEGVLMPEDFDRVLTRMKTDLMLTHLKRSLLDPRLDARDVLALTERILELQVGR